MATWMNIGGKMDFPMAMDFLRFDLPCFGAMLPNAFGAP